MAESKLVQMHSPASAGFILLSEKPAVETEKPTLASEGKSLFHLFVASPKGASVAEFSDGVAAWAAYSSVREDRYWGWRADMNALSLKLTHIRTEMTQAMYDAIHVRVTSVSRPSADEEMDVAIAESERLKNLYELEESSPSAKVGEMVDLPVSVAKSLKVFSGTPVGIDPPHPTVLAALISEEYREAFAHCYGAEEIWLTSSTAAPKGLTPVPADYNSMSCWPVWEGYRSVSN